MTNFQKGSVKLWIILVIVILLIVVTTCYVLSDYSKSSSTSVARDNGHATDIENPISLYISADPATHICQATVFAINPFRQDFTALITQTLPAGMKALSANGDIASSSIIWKNLAKQGHVIKDTFTFTLAKTPSGSTDIPATTMILTDQVSNQGSMFHAIVFPIKQNLCPTSS
jgi:hypothetical protein